MEKRVDNLYLSDFCGQEEGAARYLTCLCRYSAGETPDAFRNTLQK